MYIYRIYEDGQVEKLKHYSDKQGYLSPRRPGKSGAKTGYGVISASTFAREAITEMSGRFVIANHDDGARVEIAHGRILIGGTESDSCK